MATSPVSGYSPEELLGYLSNLERRNAPERLFVAGHTELLRAGPRVSIVGSRKASSEALTLAADIAVALSESGVVIVSGLAQGVDTVAHVAAMQSGGNTIAVLGTPLDSVYPAANRDLQRRIMQEQLAISQFAPGSGSRPTNFPRRNRTMALLSHATIIVTASEKSGTRHQGWEALRLGRQVFFSDLLAGTAGPSWVSEMVNYGARGLSLSEVQNLGRELPDPRVDLESALAG